MGADRKPGTALAARLKLLRKAKGYTLREVEIRTNRAVSNSYLSRLESGQIASPSPPLLDELAMVYDADYFELLALAYPRKRTSP